MKKQKWMSLALVAMVALISTACGKGGQVQGKTYSSASSGYGAQTGYGSGYGYGYASPYSGYNSGYSSGASETVSFTDNMRVTYTPSTGQAITGTYSFLDSSNQTLTIIPDAGAATTYTYGNQQLRYSVASDGNSLTNMTTGQLLYRR